MKRVLCVLAVLALSSVSSFAQAQDWGRYEGKIVAEWNPKDGRTMTLVEPFAYVDPQGVRWDAPKGSVVNGASIPQIAWTFVGGPYAGIYRDASVIHDVACDEKRRPWGLTHKAFYSAMRASGVSASKAAVMYAAVYHFGPRWGEPYAKGPPHPSLTKEDFEQLVMRIGEIYCEMCEGDDSSALALIETYKPPQ